MSDDKVLALMERTVSLKTNFSMTENSFNRLMGYYVRFETLFGSKKGEDPKTKFEDPEFRAKLETFLREVIGFLKTTRMPILMDACELYEGLLIELEEVNTNGGNSSV